MNTKPSLKEYKRALRNFYKIVILISPKTRIYVLILLISLIFTSISELLGLAALIPLLNSINNNQFPTDGLLGNYLSFLSLKTALNPEIILTISTVIVILIAYIARILANYYILNISNLIGLTIHNKALKNYLKLSYSDQTSSLNDNLAFCLSNQINNIVSGFIYPLITIVSSLFVILALGSGLFIVSPIITCLIIFFALIFYLTLGYSFFGNLKKGGKKNQIEQSAHLLLASNIKSFRKQIKLYSLEKFLYQKLSDYQRSIRKYNIFLNFVGILSRPLLELFILIGFALFIFILSFQADGSTKLTELIFIIIVSQKLFPVFQIIYLGNNNIISNSYPVEKVLNYCFVKSSFYPKKESIDYKSLKKISLVNVDFKYESKDKKLIFNSFNYSFNFGQSYFIQAPSGFGKSTLIDLILGLLRPIKGKVLYEGNNDSYTAGDFSLVDFVSYVPQSNFFLEGDLRFILTYNYGSNKFSDEEILSKCKIASVDSIVDSLPNGLSTYCSNNLSNFSGGQKQRFGLAQALLNPNLRLLIIDETFSNIEKNLAVKILKEIEIKFPDLTVIMVTHDESIVPNNYQTINLMNLTKK